MALRLAWLCILLALGLARPVRAAEPVDLALVLAVDVSLSMAEDETKLQRGGYASALRDSQVIGAIRSGKLGRVAITYVEWSSVTDQRVIVDWRIVSDKESAASFADALEHAPVRSGTTTSISAGIEFAAHQLATSPYAATRKVIDVSGDGYSDYGRPIKAVRDAIVAQGITINGLPVMNERPPWRESPPADLDRYYAENVIGGPGAFYMVVKDLHDFGNAVLRKLILEIADIPRPPPPRG